MNRSAALEEYARVETLLREAQARGEVRRDVDLTVAIDAFIGAAMARAILLDHPLDADFTERMVDLVVDGLRPRPPDPTREGRDPAR